VKQWKPIVPPFDFIAKIDAESLITGVESDSASNEFMNLSNKRGFELLLTWSWLGMLASLGFAFTVCIACVQCLPPCGLRMRFHLFVCLFYVCIFVCVCQVGRGLNNK